MVSLKVARVKQRVMILIPGFSIEGILAIPPQARLSDFLNTARQFIAVLDAKIFETKTNKFVQETPFVELNRDFIVSIVPLEDKGIS